MREQKQLEFERAVQAPASAELDLVVPVTTPELTRIALSAAGRMGNGLHAAVRLVKVQIVPYPMDLNESPVYLNFLKDQLDHFDSTLPVDGEIRLSRDLEQGLAGTLKQDSVVILATRRRPWRTRTESLAASLRRAGHAVVMVTGKDTNA